MTRCKHGFLSTAPRCPSGCVFTRGRPAPFRTVAKIRVPVVKAKARVYGIAGLRIGEGGR